MLNGMRRNFVITRLDEMFTFHRTFKHFQIVLFHTFDDCFVAGHLFFEVNYYKVYE